MKPVLTKRNLLIAAAGTFALACTGYAAEAVKSAEAKPADAAPVNAPSGPATADATAVASPGEQSKERKLEDTVVTAEREKADESGARRKDITALKMPESLHETPRSVTVVDAEKIRERNYNSMDDMMDSVPGVFVNSRNGGGYHYISRGFRMSPNETRMDGFRGIYAGSGQNALPLYGVDSVVFLRGPAGLLYGSAGAPGGLVNIIMRKPEEEQRTTLEFTTSTYAGNGVGFGERASIGAELDSTGALSDDFLYRVGLAGDNSDHYTADITNRNRFAQGAITWKLDDEGLIKFTPLVQQLNTETPAGAGMVMSPSSSLSTNDGSSKVNVNDLTPLDVNLYDGTRTDALTVAGFDFAIDKKESATLNAGYRYIRLETDVNTWSPVVNTAAQRAALAATGIVSRTQTKRESFSDSHNFDINGTLESRPMADWKNRLMAGVNARYVEASARNAAGPLSTPQSPIDVNTGVAGSPVVDMSTGWQPWSRSEAFEWNAYLQDQAALFDERLVVTAGVGYGQLHTPGETTMRGDVTPNASLLWNITRSVATYVSYSTSYAFADPATVYEDAAGNTFTPDPTKGDNKEVGFKFQMPGRKSSAAVALFRAERSDVLTQSNAGELNPNGNRYYFTQDGQRTEGVELAASLYLTDNWNLDGTFTWVTGSYRNGTAFDEPLAKTPEFSASLFSRHRFTEGSLKGLSHYIGVTWQDERLGGNGSRTATSPDPLMLPAFFRVDAGIDYAVTEKFRVGFHIYNLLDEVILVDGTTGANIQVDAPRTFTLKATYVF